MNELGCSQVRDRRIPLLQVRVCMSYDRLSHQIAVDVLKNSEILCLLFPSLFFRASKREYSDCNLWILSLDVVDDIPPSLPWSELQSQIRFRYKFDYFAVFCFEDRLNFKAKSKPPPPLLHVSACYMQILYHGLRATSSSITRQMSLPTAAVTFINTFFYSFALFCPVASFRTPVALWSWNIESEYLFI